MPENVMCIENLPEELPQGWTPETVEEHMTQRLRYIAREQGMDLIDGTAVEVGRRTILVDTEFGEKAAVQVHWTADVEPMPQVDGGSVMAVAQPDGTYAVDVPLGQAILGVKHGLASTRVEVQAFDATGAPAPAPGAIPVSDDEVEMVVTPEVRRVIIATVLGEGEV